MSLIEALIAIAVLSVAGMSLNGIIVNSANLSAKFSAEDTFDSFVADLQDNINYEDRCGNFVRDSVGAMPIIAQNDYTNDKRNPYALFDARNPYAPISFPTGAPEKIDVPSFAFRDFTYTTADQSKNYIYNNPSTRTHIASMKIISPTDVPEVRRLNLGGVWTNVLRYSTSIEVAGTKDVSGPNDAVPVKKANLAIELIIDPATKQIVQCTGAGGVAGSCLAIGGNFDSAGLPGQRCDLRPISGGCSSGGQFVTKGAKKTGPQYCDTPNPATAKAEILGPPKIPAVPAKCGCPTGFKTFDTMDFTGIDDTGGTWVFQVYSCMNCMEEKVAPHSGTINIVN